MSGIQISPPRRQPTPADSVTARTNAGQAGETAIALRRAQRKHQSPQRHPLTQGAAADCTVQHPAADTRCVNAPSARTFPNTKTRFRPLNICTLSPSPAGVRHNGEPPASAGAAERIKKDAHTGVFFCGTILSLMCRCRYRTALLCHRRMLARNVWSQRISARI